MIKPIIRTINYTPTFKGIHNSVRTKCYLVLYDRYLGKQPGLSLPELVAGVNGSYHSIANRLTYWIRWKYVGYRSSPRGRTYHILKRGRAWLDRHQDIMPLARYIEEIEAKT